MKEVLVESAEEMVELGRSVGLELSAGFVVALVGDLGAGKTHFTKGLCSAFGDGETTSPTFTLLNEVSGEIPLFHFDFYRVKRVEELYDLGWDDYLERGGGVIAEWANLYEEVIPDGALWIKIEHHERGRKVTIAR